MDALPIEIYNIILDYLDEIGSIISVSKYIYNISKSWIFNNCYFKSYCQNNNFTGNIIVTNLEQLNCFSKAKKIKFIGEFDDFPISTELKELTIKICNFYSNPFTNSLEKIKIKNLFKLTNKVEYFDQNLKHLEIGYCNDFRSLILPNSLLTLKLGKIPCIPELATSLKELKLSFHKYYDYSKQIIMLKNLTHLKILRIKNCGYDLSDILSDSIEILDLGITYNLILTRLPKNLRELSIGRLEIRHLKNIPNIKKLTIQHFDDLSKFNLEELFIKTTCTNRIEYPKNLKQYGKIINTMVSPNWEKIIFNGNNITEIYNNHEDWVNSGIPSENYEYTSKVDTRNKIIHRSLENGISISDRYDAIKQKIRNYSNGFLLDILSNFNCAITGFYIMELMQPENSNIKSDIITICFDNRYRRYQTELRDYLSKNYDRTELYDYLSKYDRTELHDNLSKKYDRTELHDYLSKKYDAIRIKGYYFIKGLQHLIKINNDEIFSFDEVLIKMKGTDIIIYNNSNNSFTTNTCYILENTCYQSYGIEINILNTLGILKKNKINLLLTSYSIFILSELLKNNKKYEYNFSYIDLYNKYGNNNDFIKIIETELILNDLI